MKIKPVEHPEKPGYPDYEQLAKKKGGKKLMTLIATAVATLGTMAGCKTTGVAEAPEVDEPPVVSDPSLSGDIAIDDGAGNPTIEVVELMGEPAIELPVYYSIYELKDDGNYVRVDSFSAGNDGVSFLLNDGVRTLTVYREEFALFQDVPSEELRENERFREIFPDDTTELYDTYDGDTVVLIPDRNLYNVAVETDESKTDGE